MRRTLLMLYASNWAIMHTGTTQRVVNMKLKKNWNTCINDQIT